MNVNGLEGLEVGQLIAEHIENAIEMQVFRLERRHIRDNSNPFETPDALFKSFYRFPKHLAKNLIDELEPFLAESRRNTSVPSHIKVFCALHFFAHGSYQKSVGQDFHLGLSQTTVSRCIVAISSILTELGHRYIKFPHNDARRMLIKRRFMDKFNFPGIIGCIDCTHVAIVAPPLDHEQYPGYVFLNRKGYHSLNVQIICDADFNILNCNARYPGSTHDAAIWRLSGIFRHLQENYDDNNIRGTWLLGDSGYPLQPWLLTPIEGAPEGTPEGRYTKAHVTTRNVIERCYGILKNRFRCLLKHRTLHYDPTQAAKIVMSCCVLHNILVAHNIELEEPEVMEDENHNPIALNDAGIQDRDILTVGRRIRTQLIRNHFL